MLPAASEGKPPYFLRQQPFLLLDPGAHLQNLLLILLLPFFFSFTPYISGRDSAFEVLITQTFAFTVVVVTQAIRSEFLSSGESVFS